MRWKSGIKKLRKVRFFSKFAPEVVVSETAGWFSIFLHAWAGFELRSFCVAGNFEAIFNTALFILSCNFKHKCISLWDGPKVPRKT